MTTSAVKVVEEHPNFMGQRCRQSKREMCVNYFVSILIVPKEAHNYFWGNR